MNNQIDDLSKQLSEIYSDLDENIVKIVLLTFDRDDKWLDNVINKLSELQEGSENYFPNTPLENKTSTSNLEKDLTVNFEKELNKKQKLKEKIKYYFSQFNKKSIKYKKI